MTKIVILQITTACSWVISLVNFIVSTIYLDEVVKDHSQYDKPNLLLFFVIISVWLSSFKFGFDSVTFNKLETAWRWWYILHAGFFVMLVIIFVVGVVEKASVNGGLTGNVFTGVMAIDFLSSFCGFVLTFLVGRRLDDF